MTKRRIHPALLRLSPVIFFLSSLTTALLLFRPWAACHEDDSAAGCPAPSFEVALLGASAAVATITGLMFLSWLNLRVNAREAKRGTDKRLPTPTG